MSNSSSFKSIENNYSSINSFDQLLDSLGFDDRKTLATTFVLPSINLIGTTMCALSVWIFFRRRFVDSVFVYYRLLCLVNVALLLNNIPLGLFMSPGKLFGHQKSTDLHQKIHLLAPKIIFFISRVVTKILY